MFTCGRYREIMKLGREWRAEEALRVVSLGVDLIQTKYTRERRKTLKQSGSLRICGWPALDSLFWNDLGYRMRF